MSGEHNDEMVEQIGRLTRSLHDTLRELGYDRKVVEASDALPDARDRLRYIATLTGQSAERTLNQVESAKPIQEALAEQARALTERWERVCQTEPTDAVALDPQLHEQTRTFLREVEAGAGQTGAHLLEIMMAQDFHDLTGQVVKKIVTVAQDLEDKLLALLLESSVIRERPTTVDTELNGPVIDPSRRTDVVSGQEQVDDLLASLGF